ncbi:unnamed protein product [Coregonus sp. 'balchen']|uniref:uncharacterized protein LOC121573812 n=1 Tax=Coregonus clupeaformis TaxID=59861 RepID=UPI0013E4D716|nr:uncharacterized protein LOC121573812 [Coregonus clupeaformis]CAB1352858.1 unnamed protein product [Coregonus sp. 'balchen']
MDEKLILSVFNFPELYNTTLPDYRNGDTRSLAWRRISALTALPAEECKRKWKNLRDRYFKEVRQEKRSKEETGERTTSRWKYRQLLNFLQPFIKPRNSNADHDNQDSPDTINKSTQSEIKPVKTLNTALVNNMKTPTTQVGTMSQLAFVTQLSPAQQGTQMAQLAFLAKLPPGAQISPAPQPSSVPQLSTYTTRKRPQTLQESPASPCSSSTPAKLSTKNRRLLAKEKDHRSDSTIPNRQCDEDEMFLLSFVPALKRLAPQKRCETKMKIQQIMYEAEFSVDQPVTVKDPLVTVSNELPEPVPQENQGPVSQEEPET